MRACLRELILFLGLPELVCSELLRFLCLLLIDFFHLDVELLSEQAPRVAGEDGRLVGKSRGLGPEWRHAEISRAVVEVRHLSGLERARLVLDLVGTVKLGLLFGTTSLGREVERLGLGE